MVYLPIEIIHIYIRVMDNHNSHSIVIEKSKDILLEETKPQLLVIVVLQDQAALIVITEKSKIHLLILFMN
jgi:hypothetical protein